MRNVISDLRYTVRLLLKSPGFTTTAVLILGFGIGVNTAIDLSQARHAMEPTTQSYLLLCR